MIKSIENTMKKVDNNLKIRYNFNRGRVMKNIDEIREKANKEGITILDLNDSDCDECIFSFKEKCKSLTDSRISKKCRYKIWDIVVVCFIATLANCNDFEEIRDFAVQKYNWLKKYLKLTGGIPTIQTYERVISLLNSHELQTIFLEFLIDIVKIKKKRVREILNIDGKTDNGSARKTDKDGNSIRALNSLNVFSNQFGICIAQEMIKEKTNEITAIPTLLERLNIKGKVITWDALNTQTENVKAVIKGKGDYVVALKGNQGNFHKDVILYFDQEKRNEIKSGKCGSYKYQLEKRGTSCVQYEYYQIEDVNWYFKYKDWKGLKSIGCVYKETTDKDGNIISDTRYYISSLKEEISLFSKCIRQHWSVENKLHWQLDFTFKNDDNRTVNKTALFNLQIIKKLSLNMLNKIKPNYNKSLVKIRHIIALNFEQEMNKIFAFLKK